MGKVLIIWIILIPIVVGLTYLLVPSFLIPNGEISEIHAFFLAIYLVAGVKCGLLFLSMEIEMWLTYDIKFFEKMGCEN